MSERTTVRGEFRPVIIHLARLGKPERLFKEGFVDDKGMRLRTFSMAPESVGIQLSEKFQKEGWIRHGEWIHSVSKYFFYNEFFTIVTYRDRANTMLGYYCDIVTPLQRTGDEYFLTDLILDLWIFPDFQALELDRDEFERAGAVPSNLEKEALMTVSRLKSEIEQGIFPINYVS